MKSSDMLATPLNHKPATKLTELARKPAGEGFETITYQGEDGHRCEATVKDNVIAVQWRDFLRKRLDRGLACPTIISSGRFYSS